MEQRYLIDANVIIDNFGNKLPAKLKACYLQLISLFPLLQK